MHVLSVQYFKVSTTHYGKECKPHGYLRTSQHKVALGNVQMVWQNREWAMWLRNRRENQANGALSWHPGNLVVFRSICNWFGEWWDHCQLKWKISWDGNYKKPHFLQQNQLGTTKNTGKTINRVAGNFTKGKFMLFKFWFFWRVLLYNAVMISQVSLFFCDSWHSSLTENSLGPEICT